MQGEVAYPPPQTHSNPETDLRDERVAKRYFVIFCFEAQSLGGPGWLQTRYVAKDDVVILTLLPLPPKSWDFRYAPHAWFM